jgi:hypothetical protein
MRRLAALAAAAALALSAAACGSSPDSFSSEPAPVTVTRPVPVPVVSSPYTAVTLATALDHAWARKAQPLGPIEPVRCVALQDPVFRCSVTLVRTHLTTAFDAVVSPDGHWILSEVGRGT